MENRVAPQPAAWKRTLELLVKFVPGIGDLQLIAEAIRGEEIFTGQPLSLAERWFLGIIAVTSLLADLILPLLPESEAFKDLILVARSMARMLRGMSHTFPAIANAIPGYFSKNPVTKVEVHKK